MKIFLRIWSVLALTGALVAMVLLPAIDPITQPSRDPQLVGVEPLPLRAGCPGPLVEIGGAQGADLGKVTRVGSPLVSVHGAETNPDQSWAQFEVAGAPQSTQLLSANQVQVVDRPRLRGLAAVNCGQPANFGYFISGNSGPNNESILLLGNPNQVEVLVELELILESEIVSERVSVAAGEQKEISLVALSGAEPSFALSFRTSGLGVSAYLQQRTVDGLTPTGVSLVAPQTPVIAGVVSGIEVPTEGFEPAELRIYNPGLDQALVQLEVRGDFGRELIEVSVPPGKLVSSDVALRAGANLVSFESNLPVVLALKNQILDEGLDFEWLSPGARFTEPMRLVVSRTATLFISNSGQEGIRVTASGSDPETFEVAAGSQLGVAVKPGSYLISADADFQALLSVRNSTGYAVISPSPMKNFGEQLSILVR